jgi:hypothetical protein
LEFAGVDAHCDKGEGVFFDKQKDVVDHVQIEGAFHDGGEFVGRR